MKLTKDLRLECLKGMDRYIDMLEGEGEDISYAVDLRHRIDQDQELDEDDLLVIGQVRELFREQETIN